MMWVASDRTSTRVCLARNLAGYWKRALDFESEQEFSRDYTDDVSGDPSWTRKTFRQTYDLPDGRQIELKKLPRYLCPEMLFNQSDDHFNFLAPLDCPGVGVHELIHNAVTKCCVSLRRRLYNNIVLAS